MERAQGSVISSEKKTELSYGLKFAMRQLLCLAAAFLLGRTMLFGSLPSFAVAFCSVMPSNYLFTALAGGVSGCLLSSGSLQSALIGSACVIASAAINRAAYAILKRSETARVPFVCAALCCIATGITVQAASGFSVDNTIIYLCDAALAGSAAYFFSRSRSLTSLLKGSVKLSSSEAACFAVCGCVLIISLSTFSISLFYPSGVLSALAVMVASYIAAETGGAAAGICSGVALEISGVSAGISGCFSVAGLVCGIFAHLGQTACAIAFTVIAGFYAVLSGTPEGISVLVQTTVAAIIFILIPRKKMKSAKDKFITMQTESNCADTSSQVLRLAAASNAINEVSSYIERVCGTSNETSRHFGVISEILTDTAREINRSVCFPEFKSKRISSVMRSYGIRVTGLSCSQDSRGRLIITALASSCEEDTNKMRLAEDVGRVCGCVLCVPAVSESGSGYMITFSQQARYKTRIGTVQNACESNEFCGDFFEIFSDGRGRQIVVLSDGMGTGGAAAIDASMTAELFSSLVRAGLGFDSSLKIVNTALMANSNTESLATLDVACIDLYSGKTEFMKAGAAATFVRKGSKVAALELAALPAGILQNIGFERAFSVLSSGDIIVMVSDGVLCGNDGWLLREMKSYTGTSAQELADNISRMAAEVRGELREDDTTVVCVIIE